MNYVLIFKNNDKLKEEGINISGLRTPLEIEIGTQLYLFNDSKNLEDVKTEFKEKRLNTANIFYIVLHLSTQKDSKTEFVSFFGANVICRSHVPGDFYFSVLPNLIKGSLSFDDIKSFFPDLSLETKLDLLHKLLVCDLNLGENEKELVAQNGFLLTDFENDPNRSKLIKFRDLLFP